MKRNNISAILVIKIMTIAIVMFSQVSNIAQGQMINEPYLYNQNPIISNPATYANEDTFRMYLNSHIRWIGLDGAPRNHEFGSSISMTPNMGIGISVANYSIGLFDNFYAELKYAYAVKLSKDQYLNFGLSAGLSNERFMTGSLQHADYNDPALYNNSYNEYLFSAGFGMAYTYKGFQAHIVLPKLHVLNQPENFYNFAYALYEIEVDRTWTVTPSVLLRNNKFSPYMIDGNVMLMWDNSIWGQLGYRSNNSLLLSLGINLGNYSVGYAYQLDSRPVSSSSIGSMEIQLIYKYQKKKSNKMSCPLWK